MRKTTLKNIAINLFKTGDKEKIPKAARAYKAQFVQKHKHTDNRSFPFPTRNNEREKTVE